MKISDVTKRLQAPFPKHMVSWKPGAISKDRSRALMMAHIDARAVQDRLDAICPDEWSFEVEVVPGTRLPTVKGRLTVMGVSREDIGEAPEGDLGTVKAAASDALKRCAVQFGIGRYLYDLPKTWADWDDAKRLPKVEPELPEWARPDHERTPGGAHLVQAMDQLRYELPEDVDLQREVYKHLKAALGSLHPLPAVQQTAREGESEGHSGKSVAAQGAAQGGISKSTKQQIAAHLKGPRWGFTSDARRRSFTGFLAGVGEIKSSGELTEAQGLDVLEKLQTCRDPEAKVAEWQTQSESWVA